MRRKVIKQANRAFTVTLPVDWARRNNLDRNPEVDMQIKGNALEINSVNCLKGKKIKISLDEKDRRIIAIIVSAAYAKGADEIEIISKNDISQALFAVLNSLSGFALAEQKDGYYLIKDINPGQYSDLDEIFKRAFQMVLMYLESCTGDIFGEEKETEETLLIRDKEVNKFCLYLQRAIQKQSYSDPDREKIIFTYSYALEAIGDEIGRLWRTNITKDVEKDKYMKKMMELNYEALRLSFEMFNNISFDKMKRIFEIRHQIRKMSLSIPSKKQGTSIFIRRAVSIIEHITDLRHLSLMKGL